MKYTRQDARRGGFRYLLTGRDSHTGKKIEIYSETRELLEKFLQSNNTVKCSIINAI